MRLRRLLFALKILWMGLRLRCPNCGRGRLFARGFHMHATCPYCEARYERGRGESVGGAYITIALAEISALFGFFTVDALTDLAPITQLPFWILYTFVFSVLCYRPARGLWIAIVHLTGGVYPDPDYLREYQRSETKVTPTSRRREHE
jgi:uncharacterized protein (DUF983 family)